MRDRQKTILVVEDEEKIAKILAIQLKLAGYDAHIETTGNGALTYARDHQFDLVILDLKLPDLSGYEVCKQLRRVYQAWALPVLMLTAMDQPIDQIRGFAHGANAYMTKPFDLTEVLETVALLIGETAAA